jgi:hypothetical protein
MLGLQHQPLQENHMETYRFTQLDVFTQEPFAGNPLAVFPEAEGLSDEVMMKIAREMNLSETVFVLPARDKNTLRQLRIFTPARELPFAGHPVVGTWNALARKGVVPGMRKGPSGGFGNTLNLLMQVFSNDGRIISFDSL